LLSRPSAAATRRGSHRARLRVGRPAPKICPVVEFFVRWLYCYCGYLGHPHCDIRVAITVRKVVQDLALGAQILSQLAYTSFQTREPIIKRKPVLTDLGLYDLLICDFRKRFLFYDVAPLRWCIV